MTEILLSAKGLSKRFRGLKAVDDVSFDVPKGAIVALIGPNGAGKTTTFNLIAGVYAPDTGSVTLDGNDITGFRPDRACEAGIGRTFQIVKPFGALSVADNVLVGALKRAPSMAEARVKTQEILELLGLADKSKLMAASLTLPDRKRLETARALATDPKLLLLDEVMAGLRPVEVDRMIETFRDLNQRTGLTLLLTEHVMRAVMALAQSIVVLNGGKFLVSGSPQDVSRDPRVLESYLGEAYGTEGAH